MDINAVVKVLQAARAADPAVRQPAEQQLRTLAEGNAPMFFAGMATALAKEDVPGDLRQLAGLLMKSSLDATNDVLREARASRWIAIEQTVRQQIKNMAVAALRSPVEVAAHTAAIVVAAIGGIELRAKQWPELITGLLSSVNKTHLECLGYLCEELPPEYVNQAQTNQILFAIMKGMKADQADPLRKTACTALLNTLDFAKNNMTVPAECELIMQEIFSATECTNKDVRLVAYQCLVRVAELYYGVIKPFVPRCYARTYEGITKMEEEVARQALEFWNTLAEEERELMEDAAAAAASGKTAEVVSNNYCSQALPQLVKLLTTEMCKQQEDNDDDEWNLAMASGTCLAALAITCGDSILDHVMPFITANIASEDWHMREAATLAFGSCVEGPPRDKVLPMILNSLKFLLSKLTVGTADPSVAVRDTTAWTVGRILQMHFEYLPHSEYLDSLIKTLGTAMGSDEPRVAANCCWGIHNMAQAMEAWEDPSSNLLSPYFQSLVQQLLACSRRSDWHEKNLRNTAFEALSELIQNSADDNQRLVVALVEVLLGQLETSLATPIRTADDKEEQYGLQVNLCGLLQAIMMRVEGAIVGHDQRIFNCLMKVFESPSATAHAEAYMAMGALANAIESRFTEYFKVFYPVLCRGLAATTEHQVCFVAVGVIGDVCRAMEAAILPYTTPLVDGLVTNLRNKMLERTVKPAMLSAFGDLALAVGPSFPPDRIEPAMQMLIDASKTTVPNDGDEDLLDFLVDLRTHVMEGLTAMIQGFNDDANRSLLQYVVKFVPEICAFLQLVAMDPNRDGKICYNATALVGDLFQAMPQAAGQHLTRQTPWLTQLVTECMKNGDDESVEMAKWAASLIPA